MFHVILGTVLGYLAGCTTPGLIKKLRAYFSKEVKKAETGISVEANKVGADVKKEVKKL